MADDLEDAAGARRSVLEAAESLKAIAAGLAQRLREIDERQGTLISLAEKTQAVLEAYSAAAQDKTVVKFLEEKVLPVMQDLSSEQDKLRATLLGKIDGLQGTVDLVRQDVRNSWSTADFAISNSRHGREETDKLLALISTMQRQQQILTSQVDELRKVALDRNLGG